MSGTELPCLPRSRKRATKTAAPDLVAGVAGEVNMANTFRPGEKAPASGQYEEVGPRRGGTGHEVTSVKGEPLPPTSRPGHGYILVDRTRNNSGKGK